MKVKLDDKAFVPCRAHSIDGGLDLKTPHYFCLFAHGKVVIDTGVHMAIPEGYVGMIKSRSSLNTRHSITTEGVVDSGYTGSIRVCLINHGDEDVDFDKGDRIAQILVMPVNLEEIEIVDELENTERGDRGFGSTGR